MLYNSANVPLQKLSVINLHKTAGKFTNHCGATVRPNNKL